MALINCPECGKEVSEAAANCPHCGHPFRIQKSSGFAVASLISGIFAVLLTASNTGPFFGVVGIILGAIARSKKSDKINLANIGIALSVVFIVISLIMSAGKKA